MEDGLVSVVVTTHYRNPVLEACLRSVRAQTYEPVEIVVVDGSGEGHAEPVVEGADDVTFVAMAADEGPHAARSVGVEHATGEYVQFLDDDDRLAPAKLERSVAAFEANDDVGVVYTGHRDRGGDVVSPEERFTGDVLAEALAKDTGSCQTSTMLVRGNLVRDVAPFEHWWSYDDVTLMIELARRAAFAAVDEPLVIRGDDDDRLSTRISEISPVESAREIVAHYEDLYDRYPDSRARFLARAYRAEARLLVREEFYSVEAIGHFWYAMGLSGSTGPMDVLELLALAAGKPGWLLGFTVHEWLDRWR